MLYFPNCKINIGLYITNRRPDGYHDIESVFYPVPLHDILEIVPAKQTTLHLSGLTLPGDTKDNLVWKAYTLLQKEFAGKIPPLDIYLHKVVPTGAGLGGGSADGAFMLRLINEYCSLKLNNDQLANLALRLGSDCPFFIYNTPQYAKGRGEQMQAVRVDLSAFSIQLICPKIQVFTANAFKSVTPKPAAFDLRNIDTLPVAEWRNNITNDFEKVIFQQHPPLKKFKDSLYEQGALYAAMSGSGSAVYGIFNKKKKAQIVPDKDIETFYFE